MQLSSNLFNQFIDACVEGMWIIDQDNKTTFVNEAISKMLGYPQEYFIGKEISEFTDPEQGREIAKLLKKRQAGVNEYHEALMYCKNGDPLWTHCACSALKNENGEYVGAVGMVTDITERKKDELILNAQRRVFEILIEKRNLEEALESLLKPVQVLMKNVHASILLLEGERLYHGAAFNLPDGFHDVISQYKIGPQAGSCGTAAFLKKPVIVSDIETDPLWTDFKQLTQPYGFKACWSNPILSKDGKVLGTFALYLKENKNPTSFEKKLIDDITAAAALSIEHTRLLDQERKRNEEMNILSEARFILSETLEYEDVLKKIPRLLIDKGLGSWAYICLHKIDGIYESKSLAGADYLKNDMDEKKVLEFDTTLDWGVPKALKENIPIMENVNEEFLKTLLNLPASPHHQIFIQRFIELKLKSYIAIPISSRGEVIGGIALFSNIPDRHYEKKDLDLMLEIAQSCGIAIDNALLLRKTKEAVKAREEFISIASHELRTPLTSLKMRIDLLSLMIRKESFPAPVMEKLKPIVSEIQPDIKKFSSLIENLLDISKFGRNQLELNFEMCNLSQVIEDEVARLRPPYEESQTPLITNIEKNISGSCDSSRLQQVISNLLTNALKFGNKKPVELHVSTNNKFVEISVKDSGIGISPEDKERIFRPFERAVSERHFGGLGLGLYITHQIVKAHGGEIYLSSRLGEGTTFTIFLPRS